MADLRRPSDEDHVPAYLEEIRRCYFDIEGCSEIERAISDTVREFGSLVNVDPSDFPDWHRLDCIERETLASYMTEFAHRVRAPVLMALIVTRLQLCGLERDRERTQGH
jgi:hypothetical protein